MIDRLAEDIKKSKEEHKEAALAAAVMHSEHFKSRIKNSSESNSLWKSKLG